MVEVNAHVEDRNLAKRPTIHNFIGRNMKFASIEVDFMDLPSTGNARRYDNAREYDLLPEIKKTGLYMSQIFEVIPTAFNGWSTSAGQGDTQGTPYDNATSRPIYYVSYDLANKRWRIHEVMVAGGGGNHRGEVEEVASTRFIQHVKFRVLVIGA